MFYLSAPELYKDARFEEVPQEVRAVIKLFPSKGLYLYGPVGSGKTYIAYAVALEMQRNNLPVVFFNVAELLMRIKRELSAERRGAFTGELLLDFLMDTNALLVLDDIAVEDIGARGRELLYLIIERWVNKKLPLIITSNQTIAELCESVGDRITSRIVGKCTMVELRGNDRRFDPREALREKIIVTKPYAENN